ncbi:gluconate 2-dehydrogenase subunit 3 family protein [Magnetovibrio sp. PR-2]|uniref:gluconate 2-dehydrogenase subunit 3 family protein n=1 Tax=Magnetovibrio sp. PR-2 TaxID=3120356 RepID=UPI002FCE5A8C
MIDLFCDTILPGDPDLGMPPGSSVDVSGLVTQRQANQQANEFFSLIDALALEKFGAAFKDLDPEQRLACIELSKRKNLRLAMSLIVLCLQAYYTDPAVLTALPAGAVPPFPTGNPMHDDDWTLLAPVFERGEIYRTVSS